METLIYVSKIIGAVTVIGGFIGTIFITVKKFIHLVEEVEKLISEQQKQKEEEDKSHDLLLSIARRQLLEAFNKVLLEQEMTQGTFMVISQLYNSYIENGGNSVICEMWEEIKKIRITGKEESQVI